VRDATLFGAKPRVVSRRAEADTLVTMGFCGSFGMPFLLRHVR
jgi:hypothetical protein